jgi:hypothetical protein
MMNKPLYHVKAELLKVGYVDENNVPQEWHFDCTHGIPILTIAEDGPLYGGWSVAELKEISESVS